MEFSEENGKYQVNGKIINTPEEFLMEFLKAHKLLMPESKFWDFFLGKGVMFKGRIPSNDLKIVRNLPFKPKIKECFYNSQMFSLEDGGKIKYFEGYAYDGIIPIEHAWCVIDGKVVDLTWEIKNPDNKNCVYFGVEIPEKMLRDHILKTGMSECMLWQVWENLNSNNK